MSKVICEFTSADGPVHVEIEEPARRGPAVAGRDGSVTEKASESFEDAMAGIRPIAENILAQIKGLAQAPKSVEVRFGVKLSGKLGVVLASSTAEAHIEVKIAWE